GRGAEQRVFAQQGRELTVDLALDRRILRDRLDDDVAAPERAQVRGHGAGAVELRGGALGRAVAARPYDYLVVLRRRAREPARDRSATHDSQLLGHCLLWHDGARTRSRPLD